jgi:hypothetical protein
MFSQGETWHRSMSRRRSLYEAEVIGRPVLNRMQATAIDPTSPVACQQWDRVIRKYYKILAPLITRNLPLPTFQGPQSLLFLAPPLPTRRNISIFLILPPKLPSKFAHNALLTLALPNQSMPSPTLFQQAQALTTCVSLSVPASIFLRSAYGRCTVDEQDASHGESCGGCYGGTRIERAARQRFGWCWRRRCGGWV